MRGTGSRVVPKPRARARFAATTQFAIEFGEIDVLIELHRMARRSVVAPHMLFLVGENRARLFLGIWQCIFAR